MPSTAEDSAIVMEELLRVLAKAERYVRQCRVLLTEQRSRVSQCLVNGWDASEPRRVLADMEMKYSVIVAQRDHLRAERIRLAERQRGRRRNEVLN